MENVKRYFFQQTVLSRYNTNFEFKVVTLLNKERKKKEKTHNNNTASLAVNHNNH